MAPGRGPKAEKKRRFEWKVIRIPITTLNLFIALMILAALGALTYYYRDRLSSVSRPIVSVVKGFLGKLGITSSGAPGDAGVVQDVLEKRYATLSFVTGEVKVQRVRDLNWISAEQKMKLETGDRVRTFGGARVEVLFDDGSVLKIKPDSLIIIGDLMENLKTKVRQSSVRLMVSSIEADIKKQVVGGSRFRLEMPSAVAEMDRARISVEVGPGQDSKLRVFTGQVAVDTGQKRISVNELSQVSIGAGKDISTVTQIVPAPKLTAPRSLSRFASNDPVNISITLQWQPVLKAAAYHVQVDGDRRFSNPTVDRHDVRALEHRVKGLPPGVYFARVGSLDASGQEGNYSEPIVFMIVIDKKPPEVNVEKFVSSKAPGGYDIYLEGNTEPAVELQVAGRTMVVDDQGRFSGSIRGISPREREVPLVARDRAGNQTVIPLKITGGG